MCTLVSTTPDTTSTYKVTKRSITCSSLEIHINSNLTPNMVVFSRLLLIKWSYPNHPGKQITLICSKTILSKQVQLDFTLKFLHNTLAWFSALQAETLTFLSHEKYSKVLAQHATGHTIIVTIFHKMETRLFTWLVVLS